MSQAVLVRGHLSRWTILLRLAGPVVMLSGIVLCFFNPPLALATGIGGVAIIIVVEPWLWAIRRRRRWVEDTSGGFSVTDSGGNRQYRDEQVLSLAYFQQRVHSEGVLKSVARSWSAAGRKKTSPATHLRVHPFRVIFVTRAAEETYQNAPPFKMTLMGGYTPNLYYLVCA